MHGGGLQRQQAGPAAGLKVLAWVWAALICMSTVFTKQHSIIDVVCGLAVAFVWVPVLYRRSRA